MRVLVTGGAGFIGSHLVQALLARGDDVTVFDIAPRVHPTVRHIRADALRPELVRVEVEASEYVVHLAAECGVRRVVDFPLSAMRNNLRVTENVLAACSDTRTPVLMASSSEVFGSNVSEPLHEESLRRLGPPWKPRWSYGYAKALEEAMAFAWRQELGLDVVVIRPFNVTGATHGPGRAVIPTFVSQALEGVPITVYGDGDQNRCFLHIDDAVAAIRLLIDGGAQYFGGAFNVGRADRVTMNELAQMVIEETGSPSRIVHVKYDDAYEAEFEDVMGRACDASKLTLMTGWVPQYDTRRIVAETVAHQAMVV